LALFGIIAPQPRAGRPRNWVCFPGAVLMLILHNRFFTKQFGRFRAFRNWLCFARVAGGRLALFRISIMAPQPRAGRPRNWVCFPGAVLTLILHNRFSIKQFRRFRASRNWVCLAQSGSQVPAVPGLRTSLRCDGYRGCTLHSLSKGPPKRGYLFSRAPACDVPSCHCLLPTVILAYLLYKYPNLAPVSRENPHRSVIARSEATRQSPKPRIKASQPRNTRTTQRGLRPQPNSDSRKDAKSAKRTTTRTPLNRADLCVFPRNLILFTSRPYVSLARKSAQENKILTSSNAKKRCFATEGTEQGQPPMNVDGRG